MTKARDLANIISGGFTADDIPNIDASKITSGSIADARIPNLATSKITSGTFADARISASSVTQHQGSINHDALTNFVANEHLDWTTSGVGTIHAANIGTLNQSTTGSAATLTTPRTIGGVSFDGSANINLPGVNAAGNQNTSGTAANLSGTPNVSVGTIASGNITTTGYLRGPSSFTIDPASHGDNTGTVVIAGNLQVDGTTTTINSTVVTIDDLVFNIASDAGDSAACDGAGITIGDGTTGADASLLYDHTGTQWEFNKNLEVTGNLLVTGSIDGIADLAGAVNANTAKVSNVSTNLGITGTNVARTITSSDGTNAVIPVATTSVSGVMSAAQVTTLNAAQTSANVGALIDARSSAHTITGDNSATEFTITYGFTAAAVNDVIIQVVDSYASSSHDGDTVFAEVERHSTTQCKIKFGTAPSTSHTYRVLCFKVA